MTNQFPAYNTLSMYTHILISITITYSIVISVMFFRTVNASETFVTN